MTSNTSADFRRPRRKGSALATLLFAVAFLASLFATDRIHLEDGTVLDGRVVAQDRERIEFKTSNGVSLLSKSEVARVEFDVDVDKFLLMAEKADSLPSRIEWLRKSVQAFPHRSDNRLALARALLRAGRWSEASTFAEAGDDARFRSLARIGRACGGTLRAADHGWVLERAALLRRNGKPVGDDPTNDLTERIAFHVLASRIGRTDLVRESARALQARPREEVRMAVRDVLPEFLADRTLREIFPPEPIAAARRGASRWEAGGSLPGGWIPPAFPGASPWNGFHAGASLSGGFDVPLSGRVDGPRLLLTLSGGFVREAYTAFDGRFPSEIRIHQTVILGILRGEFLFPGGMTLGGGVGLRFVREGTLEIEGKRFPLEESLLGTEWEAHLSWGRRIGIGSGWSLSFSLDACVGPGSGAGIQTRIQGRAGILRSFSLARI